LFVLLRAFFVNIVAVCWAGLVLLMMIYGAAIMMVMMVDFYPEAQEDEEVKRHWLSLSSAMLTLAQMVTYENLRQRLTELSQFSWVCSIICILLVAVASGAVLNLVVAMMVQSSYQCVTSESDRIMRARLGTLRPDMLKEFEKAHEATEDQVHRKRLVAAGYIEDLRMAVENERREAERDEATRLATTLDLTLNAETGGDTLACSSEPSPQEQDATPRRRVSSWSSQTGVSSSWSGQTQKLELRMSSSSTGNPTKPELRSVYDDNNYCTILNATWISARDLAIKFEVNQDHSSGPIRDPYKSALIWDSIRVGVDMFLPESHRVRRKAILYDDPTVGAENPLEDTGGHQKIQRDLTNQARGDLVFLNVPRHAGQYRFRFGGNYTVVEISVIDNPPNLDDAAEEIDFKQLLLTDRDHISMREVLQVLRSTSIRAKMNLVDLTEHNLVTCFQSLDVTATGIVRVNDLIDGLLRLRIPQLGVDVAGSKSNTRRLITEVWQLEKDALDSATCFSDVVQSLRGVEMVDEAEPETINTGQSRTCSRETTESSFVAEVEQTLQKEIHYTSLKVKNMRRLLAMRREHRVRVPWGQLHDVVELLDMEMREDTFASGQTITSADPGWD